jgi:hypothetical protein
MSATLPPVRVAEPAPFPRRLAAAATALALGTLAPALRAEPLRIASDAPPYFTATVPDGYTALRTHQGTEVLASYARQGDPARAVMLMLVRLPTAWPQKPLTSTTRAQLVRADPFPFQDRVASFRTLGFTVQGLRGESVVNEHRVVRFTVPIPTEGGAVALLAMGPIEEEREVQRVTESVLGSMRARTNWRTPAQRAVEWVVGIGTLTGLGLSVLYALCALLLFRRVDRWHRARGGVLLVAGLGWLTLALWLLRFSGFGTRVTTGLLLAFAVVLAARGGGMLQRARRPR